MHGWRVGEERFATLLVEPMGGDAHAHLGFSRDQDPFALVVRSEIEWYVKRAAEGGETTAPAAPPQLTLVHLFQFGFVSRRGAEHRVAVLLLETLAGKKLRFGAREVETYAAAFEEQVSRGDDELREAARRAYRSHFGVTLVDPVRE